MNRWVTRDKSHTIEHLVIAEHGGFVYTNCCTRIRSRLAQDVKVSRGEEFQCSACAHGAKLEIEADELQAAR